ncbi:hypothetical protein A7K91_08190 [Paenibacillus oryzae]|uniref:Uncharacterized protein n=2 Tax=Paenibacillus oryzae TaxID=1844972 RepID=A0A1A5YDT1_9BACL|nr:hypothetical protein A7K91_08190 [Paenibacillus oryzae]
MQTGKGVYAKTMKDRKLAVGLSVGLLLIIIAGLFYVGLGKDKGKEIKEPVTEVKELPQTEVLSETYDVIVVGTDPEGVAAAVSASRNGMKTLLIDGKGREVLGGLFTQGWLNSLDMNRMPDGKDYYNKGIFKEWFDKIEGDSFDITTAANAFHELVANEKNIDVKLGMKEIKPVVETVNGAVTVKGIKAIAADGTELSIEAPALIDATQDGDIAAEAGAEFTFGREDIGDDKLLMAVTPVYKLTGVTQKVWNGIKKTLNGDDDPGTGANEQSGWGYKEMWDYEPTNPERIRTRGLNLGRQNDESILINAVQIFGVDPFDKASIDEAYEIARKEIPLMVEHMKSLYPELEPVELGELAPELYVRETRHLVGEYRLSMVDLLEQRRHWDDIAFGSYPVDIQSTSSAKTDRGAVVMAPKQYGVPFGTLVPKTLDGLLVVGRAASFDTLPHGSARVVPLGMATAQAAGAAVKLSQEEGVSLRELSASETLIAELQKRLTDQGMDLNPPAVPMFDYMSHPAYEGLKAAASMGIAQSGYTNDFQLDAESNPRRMQYNVNGAAKAHKTIFPNPVTKSTEDMSDEEATKSPLTLQQAAYTLALSMNAEATPETALDILKAGGVKDDTIAAFKNQESLTNGDVYMMLKDILAKNGISYN